MCLICIPFSCLQLKGYDKIFQPIFVLAGNLHCGINITFEAIHWRPDVLFNLEQFVNTQIELCTITIFNERICLAEKSAKRTGKLHEDSYLRFGLKKNVCPGLHLRDFPHYCLDSLRRSHIDCIQLLNMILENFSNQQSQ